MQRESAQPRFRQGGVIQALACLPPFLCPVEELQHFSALLRLFLLFVNQDEGG
jgi:hypothetical protein